MDNKIEKKVLGLNIKLSDDTIQKLSEVPTKLEQNKVEPPSVVIDITENKTPPIVNEPSEAVVEKEERENNSNSHEIRESVANMSTSYEMESDSASTIPKEYSKYIHYENDRAIYTDPQSGTLYVWCLSSNTWILKTDSEATDGEEAKFGFENDKHTYIDADGSKYFWDTKKNAWFPLVDDDFLAHYQMSYGFVDNTTKPDDKKLNENEKQESSKNEPNTLKRKLPQAPEWFDVTDKQNTKVYVSNLPSDVTEDEFVELMQKCGLVMKDPKTQKMKVKLYTDKESNLFKGDALCCYIKIESVDLALKIIDGSELRGHKLKVERAQFKMKGEYDPSLKPKKKKKDKEKMKKIQEKLFDWRPEKILTGEPSKHERVVIVKNLFEPSLFDDQVHLILEYQEDLREECSKLGEVRKVILYDRHPEGVAQITMKESDDALKAVTLLNDRWFGKRKLQAEIWDGRTKYRIAETESEISHRISGWEKFLEKDSTVENIEGDK